MSKLSSETCVNSSLLLASHYINLGRCFSRKFQNSASCGGRIPGCPPCNVEHNNIIPIAADWTCMLDVLITC